MQNERPEDGLGSETYQDVAHFANTRKLAQSDLFWLIKRVMKREAASHGSAGGEPKRITGCVSQVEEAACLIWDELCPGMVMGDADLPHYEAAAKAVLALRDPAQAPTNRQLHDAIASAVTHRTYSGIQDAVREIQKLYGSPVPSATGSAQGGQDSHVVTLTPKAYAKFIEACENPPEPTQALKDLMRDFRRFADVAPAQAPTNRQLHDAIASAVTHRTYSGIQDAVREIQKLYGSPVPSAQRWTTCPECNGDCVVFPHGEGCAKCDGVGRILQSGGPDVV